MKKVKRKTYFSCFSAAATAVQFTQPLGSCSLVPLHTYPSHRNSSVRTTIDSLLNFGCNQLEPIFLFHWPNFGSEALPSVSVHLIAVLSLEETLSKDNPLRKKNHEKEGASGECVGPSAVFAPHLPRISIFIYNRV